MSMPGKHATMRSCSFFLLAYGTINGRMNIVFFESSAARKKIPVGESATYGKIDSIYYLLFENLTVVLWKS